MLAADGNNPVAVISLTFKLADKTSGLLTFSCVMIGTSDESIQGRSAKCNIQVSIVDQPTYEYAGVLFVSGHALDSKQLVDCTELQHILGDSLLTFSQGWCSLKTPASRIPRLYLRLWNR